MLELQIIYNIFYQMLIISKKKNTIIKHFQHLKMTTVILTNISPNNKGKKNSNFHSNTSRAYLFHNSRKIESLDLPHQHIIANILHMTRYRWLSLSLSTSPWRLNSHSLNCFVHLLFISVLFFTFSFL